MPYPNEDRDPARGFSMNNPMPQVERSAGYSPYNQDPAPGSQPPQQVVDLNNAIGGAIDRGVRAVVSPQGGYAAPVNTQQGLPEPQPQTMYGPQNSTVPTRAPAPAADGSSYWSDMKKVGGFLMDAGANAFKTIVSAPGYGFNSDMGAAAPAAPAPVPPAQQNTNPLDMRLSRGQVTSPGGVAGAAGNMPPAPQPQPQPQPPAQPPRGYYGNVQGDVAFDNRGAVSAQNMAAAGALDAASRAETAGMLAREDQAKQAADAQAFNTAQLGISRGIEQRLNAENAQRAAGFVDMKGVPQDEQARLLQQAREGAANRSTQEAIAAGGQQVQREGQQVQREGQQQQAAQQGARLGFDMARGKVTDAENVARTKQIEQQTAAQQQLIEARTAYAAALATKDQKQIDAATERLRGIQGKWEKENPGKFLVIPGGTIPDPDNPGQYIHQPSQVFDTETGTFKQAPQQQGNAPRTGQPLPPREQLQKGVVYQTARGLAKWDGEKFTPAK